MSDKIVIASDVPEVVADAAIVAAANDSAVADIATEPLTVGQLLRNAREVQGLSIGDIAARLRMAVRQISALEGSDFSALPSGTFLRGFVRNYAKTLSLDPADVLALLEKTHDNAGIVNASRVVVPTQQKIAMSAPGGELASPRVRAGIAALAAFLVLAVVWYWWENVRPHLADGGRPKAAVGTTVEQPATVPSVQLASVASAAAPPPAMVEPTAAEAPTIADAPKGAMTSPIVAPISAPVTIASKAPVSVPSANVVASAPASAPISPRTALANDTSATPAVTKSGASLGFTFNGESWVEVTDAAGKIILSRRFKAGEAEEVVGRPPLAVVVGNAQVTRMAFNGREFDLVPHTRVSVARVNLK